MQQACNNADFGRRNFQLENHLRIGAPLSKLDSRDSIWQVCAVVDRAVAILGGTTDVLEVLRAAETSLTAEALVNRVLEYRKEKPTTARKRQVADRVRVCLKVHAKRGLVLNVSGPRDRLNKWVLADRADEIAAASPRPVIQITDTMTKAMAILGKSQTGLSAKELAAKILEADGIQVTVVKRHITYKRLCHSLAIYERAGVLKNINPKHARAKKWVLASPTETSTSGVFEKLNRSTNHQADFVDRGSAERVR